MSLTAEEFIRRFTQHILPPKFRRIRHYGFPDFIGMYHLSNAAKGKALERARHSLGIKAQAKMDSAARKAEALRRMLGENPNQCRCCKEGTMVRIGIIPRARSPSVVPIVSGCTKGAELSTAIWLI